MSGPPRIELVVFDLGRVLLRIADGFEHACRLAGQPTLRGMEGDLSIHSRRCSDPRAARLFSDFETGRISVDTYLAAAAELVDAPAASVRSVLDACLLSLYPGAVELLEALENQGVPTACLSNTNARHWELMSDRQHAAYIPLERLTHCFASQLVGHAKPDAAVYRHVEQVTGAAPERILFFDDLPDNLAAANQRGWHTVLVERCDNPIPAITGQLRSHGLLKP